MKEFLIKYRVRMIVAYLGLHDPVHDGIQCLQLVALHDSFKVLGPMSERLGHRQVQVVVGLLCRQVL